MKEQSVPWLKKFADIMQLREKNLGVRATLIMSPYATIMADIWLKQHFEDDIDWFTISVYFANQKHLNKHRYSKYRQCTAPEKEFVKIPNTLAVTQMDRLKAKGWLYKFYTFKTDMTPEMEESLENSARKFQPRIHTPDYVLCNKTSLECDPLDPLLTASYNTYDSQCMPSLFSKLHMAPIS